VSILKFIAQGGAMAKKRFRPEPIIPWLREVEIRKTKKKTMA